MWYNSEDVGPSQVQLRFKFSFSYGDSLDYWGQFCSQSNLFYKAGERKNWRKDCFIIILNFGEKIAYNDA